MLVVYIQKEKSGYIVRKFNINDLGLTSCDFTIYFVNLCFGDQMNDDFSENRLIESEKIYIEYLKDYKNPLYIFFTNVKEFKKKFSKNSFVRLYKSFEGETYEDAIEYLKKLYKGINSDNNVECFILELMDREEIIKTFEIIIKKNKSLTLPKSPSVIGRRKSKEMQSFFKK